MFFRSRAVGTAFVLMSILTIEVGFTNCQPQLQGLKDRTPAASATLAFATTPAASSSTDPFASGKVQLNMNTPETTGLVQKASNSEPQIAEGTSLIAIISNECLSKNSGGISQDIYDEDQEFSNLDHQGYRWEVPKNLKVSELETLAAQDPCLIGLANDGVLHSTAVTNDPLISSEGHMIANGAIDTYDFFADPLHGSVKPVVVAVLDSGIALTHPDLKNRLWSDGSGHNGYNIYGSSYVVADDFGHGTNVAGLIAAEGNNGVGVLGVMGHNVQLMAVKIQDNAGNASISDMIAGINYAQSSHADVINISMVGYGGNAALKSALQSAASANIFIALAAGNDGRTISTDTSSNYAIPAIYGADINGVMTVGSVDSNTNSRSSFSNISTSYVEIAAPGSGSLYFTKMPDVYATGMGTSYSTPQIAGAAALMISFFKQHGISYNAAGVESILALTAYRAGVNTPYFNGGKVMDLRGLKEYLSQTYLGSQTGGFSDY